MFSIINSESPSSCIDARTAKYNVELHRKCTLKEFIKEAYSRDLSYTGYIHIVKIDDNFINQCRLSYAGGRVVDRPAIDSKIYDYSVDTAWAMGGYLYMEYFVSLKS